MNQNSDCSNGAYDDCSEEHITGDSSNESSQSSKARKKISKHHLRKASDTDFRYPCEWNDCQQITNSMNEFNHHVTQHLHSYRQYFSGNAQQGTAYGFVCQWRGCNAVVDGQMDVISRHVFYHTFHQYLKFLGLHIQTVEKLNSCALDTHSRNVIPELPEKLMCRWHDCGLVYDNPYIFYSHVTHHCEDFCKDSNASFKCKWEGCDITKIRWYTMKEHLRSHTQAKIVACPTCGSLFANNTRFIDHLLRQGHVADQKFECSHCGNRFGSERILRDHMRHHVNHYKCPMCNMTCHSPSAVRDHVRYRHSDERIFTCDQCDYKAKTQTDLRRHQTTHMEKLTFTCQKGCHMVFETAEALRAHHKTHPTKKQEYECHICAKRYNRGAHMSTHLMECHDYQWPSGHRRFRYKLHEDGIKRLQIIRYESIEVSKLIASQDVYAKDSASAPVATSLPDPAFRVADSIVAVSHQVPSADYGIADGNLVGSISTAHQGEIVDSGGKKGAASRGVKSLTRKSSNNVQESKAKQKVAQKKTEAKAKSKIVMSEDSQAANTENYEPSSKKRKTCKKSKGPAEVSSSHQIVQSCAEVRNFSVPDSFLQSADAHPSSGEDMAGTSSLSGAHASSSHLAPGQSETESWLLAEHCRNDHRENETAEGADRPGPDDAPPGDYTILRSHPEHFWTVSVSDIVDQDKKFILSSSTLYGTAEGGSGMCKAEAGPEDLADTLDRSHPDQYHFVGAIDQLSGEDQKFPAGSTSQAWYSSSFTSPSKSEPYVQVNVTSDSTLATPVKVEASLEPSASWSSEDQKCFPWASSLALNAGELYNLEMLGEVALSAQEMARKEK